MRCTALTALSAAFVIAAGPALAACPDDAAIEAYVAAWKAGEPAEPLVATDAPMEDAICAQAKLVAALQADLGPVVGYKAGLTSKPAQERFGVDQPVFGTLLEGMILEDGASVTAGDAARPLFEADLVVEIADGAVNEATTPAEVLPHIAGVRPFLELPDLAVSPDATLNGPVITASNVGARNAVMGGLVAIPAGDEGLSMLESFTARLVDADGAELSAAPGSAVLGHPLNAVIWVAETLAANGGRLEAGDLVSVGSIGPLHPMKAGQEVTLTYEGLPGTPRLTARFE